MNWKILLSIAILALGFAAFLGYVHRQSDPDRLFANLIKQMQEENYEDIYENSSDVIHLNMDKQTFIERLSAAFEKMKKADSNLGFERDMKEEISTTAMLRKISKDGKIYTTLVIEKLGTGDSKVTILADWENKGLNPKFSDLTLIPENESRQDLRFISIFYQISF